MGTGERYVAALVQHPEGDEYARLDYSEGAWNEGVRPSRPLILLGFWRGVMAEPGAKKRMLVDDQSLLDLFEQTGEEGVGGGAGVEGAGEGGEGDREAFRFVLALILLRKRLLVQEGSKGKNLMVRVRGNPRPPEGPALAEVVDPGLDEESIARVTVQLGAVLLDGGGGGGGGAEKGKEGGA